MFARASPEPTPTERPPGLVAGTGTRDRRPGNHSRRVDAARRRGQCRAADWGQLRDRQFGRRPARHASDEFAWSESKITCDDTGWTTGAIVCALLDQHFRAIAGASLMNPA